MFAQWFNSQVAINTGLTVYIWIIKISLFQENFTRSVSFPASEIREIIWPIVIGGDCGGVGVTRPWDVGVIRPSVCPLSDKESGPFEILSGVALLFVSGTESTLSVIYKVAIKKSTK